MGIREHARDLLPLFGGADTSVEALNLMRGKQVEYALLRAGFTEAQIEAFQQELEEEIQCEHRDMLEELDEQMM